MSRIAERRCAPLPSVLACTLLAVLLAAGPADAQDRRAVTVRVLPQAEVMGETFTLGEVAELDAFDAGAVQRLAKVELGRSPRPGQARRLHPSFLRSRLARELDDPARLELQVPDDARVTRDSQTVAAAAIAERVLAAAAEDAGVDPTHLEQELVSSLRDVALPRGEVSWAIEPVGNYQAAGGSRTYRVAARVNGEQAWRSLVRVDQHVYRPVVMATRAISRGAVVAEGDVELTRERVSGRSERSYLTDTEQVIGQRTRRAIAAEEWVHAGMLEQVADLEEGGRVTLLYETEGLRLTAPGVAMVAGSAGSFIPVRNLATGKVVHGVVSEHGESVKVN